MFQPHLGKHDVFSVQPRGLLSSDEKLTAIRVRPRVGHGDHPRPIVLENKVFVLKEPGAEAAEARKDSAILVGKAAA